MFSKLQVYTKYPRTTQRRMNAKLKLLHARNNLYMEVLQCCLFFEAETKRSGNKIVLPVTVWNDEYPESLRDTTLNEKNHWQGKQRIVQPDGQSSLQRPMKMLHGNGIFFLVGRDTRPVKHYQVWVFCEKHLLQLLSVTM